MAIKRGPRHWKSIFAAEAAVKYGLPVDELVRSPAPNDLVSTLSTQTLVHHPSTPVHRRLSAPRQDDQHLLTGGEGPIGSEGGGSEQHVACLIASPEFKQHMQQRGISVREAQSRVYLCQVILIYLK